MNNRNTAILNIAIGILFVFIFLISNLFTQSYGIEFEITPRVILVSLLSFIIGVGMIIFGAKRLSFVKRTEKITKLIEHYQSPNGVGLQIFADSLKVTELKVISLIQELIHFGYINRIVIDYQKNKIIYLDTANVDGENKLNFINIKCPNCGVTNLVAKGKGFECEYCGSSQMAPDTAETVVANNIGTNSAEMESLKEDKRIGCGIPILIALVDFYLILLFAIKDGINADNFPFMIAVGVAPLTLFAYFIKKIIHAIKTKKTRPIVARYLATVIHTRKPEGIKVSELAKILKEDPAFTAKNLKFLIKYEYLAGVTYDERNSIIKYLDDNVNYDRFAQVYCGNCNGEFVATYGKANKCPYCGNGVTVQK